MRGIRRKEKEISNIEEIKSILCSVKYITVAMANDDTPYLVTLSSGYDQQNNCFYFHCANEGKKIDYLTNNNVIWGQALKDLEYLDGKCNHQYASVHFKGTVQFLENFEEKYQALSIMIDQLEKDPDGAKTIHLKKEAIDKVTIGKIDINFLSGKKGIE